MEFKGKVAVVTGAANGIGRATAIAFGNEGAAVVVVDVDESGARTTAEEITSSGGKAVFVKADVSSAAEVKRIPEGAKGAFGGVDILHNNAGIQHYGTAVTTSEEEWDRVLGINLTSMFLCSKYCIPEMQKRGGGAIINTSSVQGIANQPNVAPYAVSKAGILALTRSMAVDFAASNIRVNAVCPGSTETPLLRFAASENATSAESEDDLVRKWGSLHPIGRVGKPEEVAQVVLFLASTRSSFVTGAHILVDGGLMAKLF